MPGLPPARGGRHPPPQRRASASPCFVRHCQEQVRRAIDAFDMIRPGDRVLVAVSGGKDSLALWDLLLDAGRGGRRAVSGPRDRRVQRRVRPLRPGLRRQPPGPAGGDRPAGASSASTSRPARRRPAGRPCSACGLSKRHLFNQAALDGDYDVVATGHNLDDEAAVLFGNVLRWDLAYLGRQYPVLPASHGFARKVKPLIRLGEREMAAYCVLRGIDYIVEECPMAAGNRHLGYKEALNAIEVTSPGSKAAFYFGFLDRMAALVAAPRRGGAGRPASVPRVRVADHQRAVRLLQAGRARRRRAAQTSGPR